MVALMRVGVVHWRLACCTNRSLSQCPTLHLDAWFLWQNDLTIRVIWQVGAFLLDTLKCETFGWTSGPATKIMLSMNMAGTYLAFKFANCWFNCQFSAGKILLL